MARISAKIQEPWLLLKGDKAGWLVWLMPNTKPNNSRICRLHIHTKGLTIFTRKIQQIRRTNTHILEMAIK